MGIPDNKSYEEEYKNKTYLSGYSNKLLFDSITNLSRESTHQKGVLSENITTRIQGMKVGVSGACNGSLPRHTISPHKQEKKNSDKF